MNNAENSPDFSFLVISGPSNWEVDVHETHTSYFSSLTANKQEQMNNEPSPVREMMRLTMICVACNEVESAE